VGAVVIFGAFSGGGIIPKPALAVESPIALLPVDQAQAPDFIAWTYDPDADTYQTARINPAKRSVVWRGKTYKDIGDLNAIVAAGDKFFAVAGTGLYAYRSSDGTLIWQAALSDKLGYCAGCLTVRGDRVVALTQDYNLEAFDTENGASAWQRRLDGYTSDYSIADGAAWVIDKTGDGYSLLALDLADGKVRQQIAPECSNAHLDETGALDSSSVFLFDPDPAVLSTSRAVYFLYGSELGCLERWNAPYAAKGWQTINSDGFSFSGDYALLPTADTLFFAADNNLWAADKTTGKLSTLSQGGDYKLVPLTLAQGVLIVRTERTRGTPQFGLIGVDPAGGNTLWQYTIDKGAPLDEPDSIAGLIDGDQSGWTWRILGDQMVLMIFQGDPNQLVFQTINPKDGTVAEGKTVALNVSGDFYAPPAIIAWRDPVAWFLVESDLVGFDAGAMSIKFSYP
jgi:outer membrane protein assembly factor BamB